MTNTIFNFDVIRSRIKSHRWCSGRFYTICYNQNTPRALTWIDRKSGIQINQSGILMNLRIYILKNQFFPASEKRFDRRKSEMIEQLRRSDLMTNNIFNFDVTRLRIKSHRWCSGRFYTICYSQNTPRALTWIDRKSGIQINQSGILMNLRICTLKNLVIGCFAGQ
jgi:hypothetical protein